MPPGFQTASARSRSCSASPAKYSRTSALAPFLRFDFGLSVSVAMSAIYPSSAARSASASVTGAWQVKLSHTYAAARPSTAARP
jgi:hypothetical protein